MMRAETHLHRFSLLARAPWPRGSIAYPKQSSRNMDDLIKCAPFPNEDVLPARSMHDLASLIRARLAEHTESSSLPTYLPTTQKLCLKSTVLSFLKYEGHSSENETGGVEESLVLAHRLNAPMRDPSQVTQSLNLSLSSLWEHRARSQRYE